MFSHYLKAFYRLGDGRIRAAVVKTALFAIAAIAAIWALGGWGVSAIPWEDWLSPGWIRDGLSLFASLGAIIGGLVLTILLFPAVMTAILGLFIDDIIDAVEARDYPGLPEARRAPLSESAWGAVKFAAVAILLNLLALPLYFFLPVLNLVIFYGLNGYLAGREYFEAVAIRRHTPDEAKAIRRQRYGQVFASGVFGAVLLSIPVLNLIAPVLVAAAMTHRYHGGRHSVAGESRE